MKSDQLQKGAIKVTVRHWYKFWELYKNQKKSGYFKTIVQICGWHESGRMTYSVHYFCSITTYNDALIEVNWISPRAFKLVVNHVFLGQMDFPSQAW